MPLIGLFLWFAPRDGVGLLALFLGFDSWCFPVPTLWLTQPCVDLDLNIEGPVLREVFSSAIRFFQIRACPCEDPRGGNDPDVLWPRDLILAHCTLHEA